MLDEVRKVFSAWITPGVVTPPFVLTKTPQVTADFILRTICEKYFVSPGFLQRPVEANGSKKVKREDRVYLRQMFCYTMRNIYKQDASYKWLGSFFDQDRTTAMHSVERFQDRIFTNELVLPEIAQRKLSKKKTVREDYAELTEMIRPWL